MEFPSYTAPVFRNDFLRFQINSFNFETNFVNKPIENDMSNKPIIHRVSCLYVMWPHPMWTFSNRKFSYPSNLNREIEIYFNINYHGGVTNFTASDGVLAHQSLLVIIFLHLYSQALSVCSTNTYLHRFKTVKFTIHFKILFY